MNVSPSKPLIRREFEPEIVIDFSTEKFNKEHLDLFQKIFAIKNRETEGVSSIVIKGTQMSVNYSDGRTILEEIDKDVASLASTLLMPPKAELEKATTPTPASELQKAQVQFQAAMEKFETSFHGIQIKENEKTKELLNKLFETYQLIATIATESPDKLEQLNALKQELDQFSLELKETFDVTHKTLFDVLEKQLVEMTQAHNKIVDAIQTLESQERRGPQEEHLLKNLQDARREMQTNLHKCNEQMSRRSLSTNTYTAYRSHVMDFASVVERRFALEKEKYELHAKNIDLQNQAHMLDEQIKLQKSPNDQVNTKTQAIKKEIKANAIRIKDIDKDLDDAPKIHDMKGISNMIQRRLHGLEDQLLTNKEIKEAYKSNQEQLQWGKDYRAVALTTPANWTMLFNASVKKSHSGRMYVCVVKNEPLNIDTRGGVPAWLRDAKGQPAYRRRAANLYKTTQYVNVDGKKQFSNTSFRGAQLPTVEAAKEALHAMIEDSFTSEVPLELHINALLTPTSLPHYRKDKLLLAAHRENIKAAINELKKEYKLSGNQAYFNICNELETTLAISNFGVNEAASGTYGTSVGWHTAIGEYSNEASQKLTESLRKTLEKADPNTPLHDAYNPTTLDLIGSIAHLGLDMEAVWAENTFADGDIGHNQFKLPLQWKVMDALLGVCCYTNCMSGKDRTGEVVSHAQGYLDEIIMHTLDHKKNLGHQVTQLQFELDETQRSEWIRLRPYLTAACFTLPNIRSIYNEFKAGGDLESIIRREIEIKITRAQQALEITQGRDFMIPKTVGSTRRLGTQGISTTTPKLQHSQCILALHAFPRLVPSTLSRVYELHWDDMARLQSNVREGGGFHKLLMEFQKRQREAENVWLSQINSLSITQTNTGKPGFKLTKGEPLARASSGFDRDYVLLKIWGHLEGLEDVTRYAGITKEFADLVGLDQFDPVTQQKLITKFEQAIKKDKNACMEDCIKLLKKIEKLKVKNFSPAVTVKS